MKILFVEDDDNKVSDVKKFLIELLPNVDITIKNSSTSGIRELREKTFDLIILDMSLPLYDLNYSDDDFETFAGIDILEEMSRIGINTNVMVITAFDVLGENDVNIQQLDLQMNEDFPEMYKGIIHYQKSSLEWTSELTKILSSNYKY